MISEKNRLFRLDTKNSSLWIRVTKFGHIENIHYGPFLSEQDERAIALKRTSIPGSSVVYDESDPNYCLDCMALEWSGIGKGDYRHSPCEIKMPDGSFTSDFVYQSHSITNKTMPAETLPGAYGSEEECKTLEFSLLDESNNVELKLYYTVFEESNVITRRAVIKNNNTDKLVLRRVMSMMTDIPDRNFDMVTFDGGWIKEAHRHSRPLQYGMFVNSSTTGASSNRHNPGFLLAEKTATEDYGYVYGFNIVYSGNHYGAVELSNHDIVRVQLGINPHCFEWELNDGESFETPEAVMTFSSDGYSGLSTNFHDFVNENIVRSDWKNKERPVLINNWEATFFKFNERKLKRMAKQAKALGIEFFVLDDGWFGKRDNDLAGLGDYNVNRKKLPHGIDDFSRKIKRMGMDFGLWFEPEMVNPDSDLFRSHPEYAVQIPGKKPALGRNQMVLDLVNPDVRDYIVENVSKIIDEADISYVKWDMNRHISDAYSAHVENQGEFFHRYILGLYDILGRIFEPRPHVLLESCSSGGNRFDLGMLCYSPQVWASDDTDPIERLKIQDGLSCLYPLSAMGAHVSEAPHQQTLRSTTLTTRFNVSCFGCLGFEMDLKHLSKVEKKEVKNQIEFYKNHRRTFQYGRFDRIAAQKSNKTIWQCTEKDGSKAVSGFFQTQATASEGYDFMTVKHLNKNSDYRIKTRPQSLFIRKFGGLIKHVLPLSLNPEGFLMNIVNRLYCLTDCVESYECRGDALLNGIRLNNQFIGSYYNENIRLLGDFGSNLYVTEKVK